MESEITKFCPLDHEEVECGEWCGWWDEKAQCCGLISIVKNLREISCALMLTGQIVNELRDISATIAADKGKRQ